MSFTQVLDSRIEQAYALLFILVFLQKQDWIEEKALVDQLKQLSIEKHAATELISYLHGQKLLTSKAQRLSFFKYQYLYHLSPDGEELISHYYHKYHLPLTQMFALGSSNPALAGK